MKRLLIVIGIMSIAAQSRAVHSLTIHQAFGPVSAPTDTTKICIKWKQTQDPASLWVKYTNIKTDTSIPNVLGDFYAHFLVGSYSYDSLVNA